jgi:glycosyltransferase involved in cell wall biosynthesis
MPSITALLHTHNDALRLGRCLETLYPCNGIVIIDHASTDATVQIARQYGTRIVPETEIPARPAPEIILTESAAPSWILHLRATESVSESLAASLFELRSQPANQLNIPPYSMFLREETASGWQQHPIAETRLVPPTWSDWVGNLPRPFPSATVLEGELLRFAFP